jgi:hypothetical protein
MGKWVREWVRAEGSVGKGYKSRINTFHALKEIKSV